MMYKYLETERLLIRPLRIDDAAFVMRLLNSKGWIQFIGDRNVSDNESAKAYINKILSNNKFFYNVIELKASTLPIGIVSLIYRENQQFPDIGFAILPEFEKKGYAFEATKQYLEAVKKESTIEKIIAITKPDNVNSINLLKKLGLVFEKTYVDNNEALNLYAT